MRTLTQPTRQDEERNATQHKRRHRMPLWLQCDAFIYGRINLEKALTAGFPKIARFDRN
jgi:hypothetical protein